MRAHGIAEGIASAVAHCPQAERKLVFGAGLVVVALVIMYFSIYFSSDFSRDCSSDCSGDCSSRRSLSLSGVCSSSQDICADTPHKSFP